MQKVVENLFIYKRLQIDKKREEFNSETKGIFSSIHIDSISLFRNFALQSSFSPHAPKKALAFEFPLLLTPSL